MRAANEASEAIGTLIRFGSIASVDLGAARCRVKIGDVETSDIRWIEGRAGASRSWSPPSVGEQVLVLAEAGELAGAVALRGVISTAHPAAGDSIRELIAFTDGAVLAYDPEAHTLDAILPGGATARIEASGGITLIGDVTVEGTLTASVDVIADGISLKTHKHGGVQAGGAQTGVPA